jgi:hypothetical protein
MSRFVRVALLGWALSVGGACKKDVIGSLPVELTATGKIEDGRHIYSIKNRGAKAVTGIRFAVTFKRDDGTRRLLSQAIPLDSLAPAASVEAGLFTSTDIEDAKQVDLSLRGVDYADETRWFPGLDKRSPAPAEPLRITATDLMEPQMSHDERVFLVENVSDKTIDAFDFYVDDLPDVRKHPCALNLFQSIEPGESRYLSISGPRFDELSAKASVQMRHVVFADKTKWKGKVE